nr:hypothetical protein [Anaerolineales bacterium]
GGADADTFIFALGGSIGGLIDGGASGDTLVGTDTANTWEINGSDAGALNGQVFTGIENLTGGAEADAFVFADGSSISGAVDGGGGSDTLDYSAYTTGITIDLGTGGATGTGGISNIENIIGGLGADTLIGPDSDSIWYITGTDAGSVGGVVFSGIENLTGGAGADTFIFADGSRG